MKSKRTKKNVRGFINPDVGGRKIWSWYAFFYDIATLNAAAYQHFILNIVDMISTYMKEKSIFKPNVIDACCGTGNLSRAINRNIANVNMKGIDFTSTMIDIAKKKCPKVDFEVSDLKEGLGKMQNNWADIIVLKNGFYALPDQEAAIVEMNRVLKKGGRLILSDAKVGAKLSKLILYQLKYGSFKQIIFLPFSLFALLFSLLLQHGVHYTFLQDEEVVKMLKKNGMKILRRGLAYANQNYLIIAEKEDRN